MGTTIVPTGTSNKHPHDPNLRTHQPISPSTSQSIRAKHTHRTTTISPLTHSLTSRTKKSTFGYPIPILTTLTGTPPNLPVSVRNPRSLASLNTGGFGSKCAAMPSARLGEPTVIYTVH